MVPKPGALSSGFQRAVLGTVILVTVAGFRLLSILTGKTILPFLTPLILPLNLLRLSGLWALSDERRPQGPGEDGLWKPQQTINEV